MNIQWEPIGGGLSVAVNDHCRISEDGVLLSRFASPSPTDIAADLGTGNGIIPLLWCRRHPPQHITAIEKERLFYNLADAAVSRHALQHLITVRHGDWNDDACLEESAFSLVTCNPPYFPFGASRTCADPLRTAARHEESADTLPSLCRAAARALAPNGRFCLCHRPERLGDVLSAVTQAGLTPRRLQFVQRQDNTAPWLFLLETAKSGTLRVLPTLIQTEKGTHTENYKRLY